MCYLKYEIHITTCMRNATFKQLPLRALFKAYTAPVWSHAADLHIDINTQNAAIRQFVDLPYFVRII